MVVDYVQARQGRLTIVRQLSVDRYEPMPVNDGNLTAQAVVNYIHCFSSWLGLLASKAAPKFENFL